MRHRITHEIVTTFEPACPGAIRELRMTPRTFDGQYVGDWRIDVDHDCRLDRVLDAYGNLTHTFTVAGPVRTLTILATGEVEVDDTAGILTGSARERLSPGVFRRTTPLTEPNAGIRTLADRIRNDGGTVLEQCHRLKSALHRDLGHVAPKPDATLNLNARPAAEVLAEGRANPVDAAHLYVAVARALGFPARVVTGYCRHGDERDYECAAHAWAEAHVDGLGWVGFDVGGDCCPTDAYVRVSASLDIAGASFVRGAEHGVTSSTVACRASIVLAEH
jgi:transglutaminase-like putative cysteine protease